MMKVKELIKRLLNAPDQEARISIFESTPYPDLGEGEFEIANIDGYALTGESRIKEKP